MAPIARPKEQPPTCNVPGLSIIAGKFVITGASGAVASYEGFGVDSVARTAEGVYTITLDNEWVDLMYADATLELYTGSANLGAEIRDQTVNTLKTCIDLLNDLRTQYEAHRILVAAGGIDAHATADTTNVIAKAAATDLSTAIALANDLKAKFNAHLPQGTIHALGDDVTNTTTEADASDLATLKTLVNALRTDYEAHRVLASGTGHTAADTANNTLKGPVGTAKTIVMSFYDETPELEELLDGTVVRFFLLVRHSNRRIPSTTV